MTRKVAYDIKLSEIGRLLKHRYKLICIVVVLFVLLCGGYKAVSHPGGSQDFSSNGDYENEVSFYNYVSEAEEGFSDLLKDEWKSLCYDRLNNPVFSIDPYKCELEQIVIRFDDDGDNHDWTVSNWILQADDGMLFGEQKEKLSDYKTCLITIGQKEEQTETSETAVQLLVVDGYDAKEAADYLIKQFQQNAAKDNIGIENITKATANGYSEYVDKYQQKSRETYDSIHDALANAKDMSASLVVPTNPADAQQNKPKDIIRFCLIGLILGFILSIVYIIVDAVRKREIISARQVEDAFGIELLSDCSSANKSSLDVLNANLDVMTSEHSTIAIITDNLVEGSGSDFSNWAKKSDRTFIECSDIFDNPAMIEALRKADGIVIGVKIGKSKLEQIQRVILRADKLNLNVLGFVLV